MLLHWALVPAPPPPAGPFRVRPLFSNTGQAPWLLAEFKVLRFKPPFDEEPTLPQAGILFVLPSDLLSGASAGT